MSSQRRIVCTSKGKYPPIPSSSSSLVRTLIGKFPHDLPISSFRLLRVCLVNSHYVGDVYSAMRRILLAEEESGDNCYEETCGDNVEDHPLPRRILSSVSSLWNLQTLILLEVSDCLLEIRKMPLLRHVMSHDRATFYDPPLRNDEDVLKNLPTLFTASNLNFGEGVLERIPNVRKLKLAYHPRGRVGGCSLHNVRRLHKLHDLHLISDYSYSSVKLMRELTLLHSLKKLVLDGTELPWEDMKVKISCLPLLQVLKLKEDSFTGSEWETVEGQFSSLKYLLIAGCSDLEYWVTDNTHFPCLEHLVLQFLTRLRGIPSSIGDIPTLRSITVEYCSDYADEYARRIVEEQEEYGNDVLQLRPSTSSDITIFFLLN